MRFTDSPYETLMQELPRPKPPAPIQAPKGTRCHGCPYSRGIGCVTCYRELLKKPACRGGR